MRFNPATEDPSRPHDIEALAIPGISREQAALNVARALGLRVGGRDLS